MRVFLELPHMLCIVGIVLLTAVYGISRPDLTLPAFGMSGFSDSFLVEPVKMDGGGGGSRTRHFRGDAHRTGLHSFLSPQVNAVTIGEYNWNLGIHTASKSSPVIFRDEIYVGNDSGEFVRFSKEGKRVWTFRVPDSSEGIHGSAVVAGDSVCFGTYGGDLICLSRDTGELKWARNLGHAVGASPLVVEDTIFLSVELVRPKFDGYVVALNLIDGALIWKSEHFGEHPHSSPSLSTDGKVLGVGANNGLFYGIDRFTGTILWNSNLGGPIKSTALSWEGTFFISSWGKALFAVDARTGEKKWTAAIPSFAQGSATLLSSGRALVQPVSGAILIVRTEDGKILREHRVGGGGGWGNMPSAAAFSNAVWITCGYREICRFSADGQRLEQSIETDGFLSGEPGAAEWGLVLATTDRLLFLYKAEL